MQMQLNTRWVWDNTFSGELLPIHIWGELMEAYEALMAKDLEAAFLELQQVYLYIMLYAYKRTGINLPLYGVRGLVEEDFDRFEIWRSIFALYGVPFSLDLFEDGNNWRRPHKVVSTLARAGVIITMDEAEHVIYQVSPDGTGRSA